MLPVWLLVFSIPSGLLLSMIWSRYMVEDISSVCQEYVYMVHLFPLFHPFFLLFQLILMDCTPFYPLFIHLNVPPIVCSMRPVSDSSLSLCDQTCHILILSIPRPVDNRGPFLFHRHLPHP